MRPFRPAFGILAASVAAALTLTACASSAAPAKRTPSASLSFTAATGRPTTTAPTITAPTATPPGTTPAAQRTAPHTAPATSPTATKAPTAPKRLPLTFSTGDARQVITVVAPSTSSTTATLQAWQRSGDRWVRVGSAAPANLGSDGLSTHASESRSATPIGSFTLTHAFGHDSDPGTALPYVRTTPSDWWISQEGDLYNTRQRCASDCPFTRGAPNEHLYYETPAYDYAVVIDYNTHNAPGGVKAGAGSAFFLHVSEGKPTAGCVSIPMSSLVRIMRWLNPGKHPRIVIGT